MYPLQIVGDSAKETILIIAESFAIVTRTSGHTGIFWSVLNERILQIATTFTNYDDS